MAIDHVIDISWRHRNYKNIGRKDDFFVGKCFVFVYLLLHDFCSILFVIIYSSNSIFIIFSSSIIRYYIFVQYYLLFPGSQLAVLIRQAENQKQSN